jgi:hypothetical protein
MSSLTHHPERRGRPGGSSGGSFRGRARHRRRFLSRLIVTDLAASAVSIMAIGGAILVMNAVAIGAVYFWYYVL